MFGPMGLEGSAVPASENPGEHGVVGKTKGRKVGWIASSDLSRNDTEIISHYY